MLAAIDDATSTTPTPDVPLEIDPLEVSISDQYSEICFEIGIQDLDPAMPGKALKLKFIETIINARTEGARILTDDEKQEIINRYRITPRPLESANIEHKLRTLENSPKATPIVQKIPLEASVESGVNEEIEVDQNSNLWRFASRLVRQTKGINAEDEARRTYCLLLEKGFKVTGNKDRDRAEGFRILMSGNGHNPKRNTHVSENQDDRHDYKLKGGRIYHQRKGQERERVRERMNEDRYRASQLEM